MSRNWTSPMKWDNQGSEPSETLKTSGFSGGYKPPASVFNYLFNKVKTWITELQCAVDDIDSNAFNKSDADKLYSEKTHKHEINGVTGLEESLNNIMESVNSKKSLFINKAKMIDLDSSGTQDLNDYKSDGEWYFYSLDSSMSGKVINKPSGVPNLPFFLRVEKFDNDDVYGDTSAILHLYIIQTITDTRGIEYRRVMLDEVASGDPEETGVMGKYWEDWHVVSRSSNDSGTSFSFGGGCTVTGNYNISAGYDNRAGNLQVVVGKYSDTSSSTDKGGVESTSATTGSLFTVGNGTSSSNRTNALRVSASGKCYGSTSFGGSGAGLAEYWEWSDGNPNNEDRRGHFVTLDGDKIRIANPDDSYILGVIDPCPFIVGDIQSESWKDMYLKDVFGEKKTETVTVPESVDENTGETIPEHTETRFIINPEYDNSNGYISREDRTEWDSITQHGKVVMIDDGTCEVNKYCDVGNGGIATASNDNYKVRVLKRIDDTHIQVFIDGVFVKQ